jgi:uncharacterized protein YuzE
MRFSIETLNNKTMKITYFKDTDTMLVNFNDNEITETRDLTENVLIELDKNGNLVSMTIEHAQLQTEIASFSYNQIEGLQAR